MNPGFAKEVGSFLGPLEEPLFCRICETAPLWTIDVGPDRFFIRRNDGVWQVAWSISKNRIDYKIRFWEAARTYPEYEIYLGSAYYKGAREFFGHVWVKGRGIEYYINDKNPYGISAKEVITNIRPQHRLALRVLVHKLT